MRRDARLGPSGDGANSAAHLIGGRSTGVVERGVGADRGTPRAPDIVVHDGNEVEDRSKAGDIRARGTSLILPRQDGRRGREDQALALGVGA